MKQKWKYIPSYEGYMVSSDGEVMTLPGKRANGGTLGHLLSPRKNQMGYLQVAINNDLGERKWEYVHRLVAMAWIPKKQNQRDCNVVMHKDDNTLNNNKSNLSWGTQFQNMQGVSDKRTKVTTRTSLQSSSEKVFILLDKNKDFVGKKTELIGLIAKELGISYSYVNLIIYSYSYQFPHLRERFKHVLKEKKK